MCVYVCTCECMGEDNVFELGVSTRLTVRSDRSGPEETTDEGRKKRENQDK